MPDQEPAVVGGDGDSAAGIDRSGGALQDAAGTSASGGLFVPAALAGAAPFLWSGGLQASSLGALLAVAGVPPGVAVGPRRRRIHRGVGPPRCARRRMAGPHRRRIHRGAG
jgi:hypothetical protein